MVYHPDNSKVTEEVVKGSLLESSKASLLTADLQAEHPSLRSRPGSPRWAVISLVKRVSLLNEIAEKSAQPDIKLVWPDGSEPLSCPADSDKLWEEILVKFGASQAPAKLSAQHFNRIIQVGMNANAVPFPRMPLRQGVSKKLTMDHMRHGCELPVTQQDTLTFPFLSKVEEQWTNRVEEEAYEMLLAGRAKHQDDLRKAFYTEPPLDMELVPWPTLPSGVVANDVRTDAQVQISELRNKRPLALRQLEQRRAELAEKLKGPLNRSIFEECMPKLEREAALLELQASRARDKATESAQYDDLAALGAQFVAWPVPNERRWPELPSAWKNHCKWFAMWRSQPPLASEFAFKPMKRSDSLSSIGSWAAVSDISWIEIESKASECSWQEVFDEQASILAAAKPTNIQKADLTEIKCMSKPPAGVVLTMEVICILLQVPPIKIKNGGLDYWAAGKELLNDPGLLAKLDVLSDHLPASALDAVAPYMSLESFTPEVIGKCSMACKALCIWAREVYKYHTLGQAVADAEWRDYASKPMSELLVESQHAIEELPKAALQELKALGKPPADIALLCSCFLHLFAGIAPEVELTKAGNVKDASWKACQKFMSNPSCLLARMHDFRDTIDAGAVPMKNFKKARKVLREMGHVLNPKAMKVKSVAAECLCRWLVSTIAYSEQHVAATPQQPQVDQEPSLVKTVADASKYLSKADIVEIKSLSAPPQPVMVVCVCVCLLLGYDGNSGWAEAKAMLSDARFLKTLIDLKKEDVSREQVDKVREIINGERDTFEGDNMKSVSKAANGLLQWVKAIIEIQ